MPQEALRSAPPSSSTDDGALADVPESIAAESSSPLALLMEEVRSPGMVRADIDALIVGLGRPPAPDEPPRERADLLLGLLDRSNPLGDYTGSGGMKVRHAAKEALLAMGYPYAMELPPDLLETQEEGARKPGLSGGDITLALVSALYQSGVLVATWYLLGYHQATTGVMLSVGAGIWLATLCALMSHHSRARNMQIVASTLLWVATVGWFLVALPAAVFTSGLALVVAPWHLALWTAISLRPEAEEEEPPAPKTRRPRSSGPQAR
ncbi:hypothetical protein [Corallococcus sp. EGB]|uniref:hypothetical protein n=1 Tax=Corallococcus sp. EGB TaxID=1521117 RepID=UPI001CBCABB9|nr:hypothetical protein [Corallococcus sp. EGB]